MRSLWLLLLLMVLGCQSNPEQHQKQAKNLCHYSDLLTIIAAKNGFLIQIQNPEQPKEIFEFQLNKPFKRIAVLSATHVGMLAAIDQQQRLCAIPDKRYLHDPLVKKAVAKGKVADLKSEQQLSIQKLLAHHTQALVYSGFGPEQAQIKRLRSIGMTCIPNYEWRETHPLARAEWILLFGAMTGQFAQAQQYFKKVCQNYKRSKTQPTLCNSMPVVISGYVYGDQWVAPAANSFEARLYADVDFAYYFNAKSGTGSCFSSIQSVQLEQHFCNNTQNTSISPFSKSAFFAIPTTPTFIGSGRRSVPIGCSQTFLIFAPIRPIHCIFIRNYSHETKRTLLVCTRPCFGTELFCTHATNPSAFL
jgi:ABC-type Fe3+-hydroxamate transport system substrate-binding protein